MKSSSKQKASDHIQLLENEDLDKLFFEYNKNLSEINIIDQFKSSNSNSKTKNKPSIIKSFRASMIHNTKSKIQRDIEESYKMGRSYDIDDHTKGEEFKSKNQESKQLILVKDFLISLIISLMFIPLIKIVFVVWQIFG